MGKKNVWQDPQILIQLSYSVTCILHRTHISFIWLELTTRLEMWRLSEAVFCLTHYFVLRKKYVRPDRYLCPPLFLSPWLTTPSSKTRHKGRYMCYLHAKEEEWCKGSRRKALLWFISICHPFVTSLWVVEMSSVSVGNNKNTKQCIFNKYYTS